MGFLIYFFRSELTIRNAVSNVVNSLQVISMVFMGGCIYSDSVLGVLFNEK